MRNRLRVFFVICTLLPGLQACDTANNLPKDSGQFFVKYYGEDGDQTAVDMVADDDGSIVILANSNSGNARILLIKVGPGGEIIWQKKFGGATDVARDLEQKGDHTGYVILSQFQETAGNSDVKLTVVSNDGSEPIPAVTHGSPANDFPNSITSLQDGGFVIAGYSEYSGWTASSSVEKSIMHYRCNSNFQFRSSDWVEYAGSGQVNVATKVVENGNNLYAFGYTNSVSGLANDFENPKGKMVMFSYGLGDTGPKNSIDYYGDADNDTQSTSVINTVGQFEDGYLIVGTFNYASSASKLRLTKLRNPPTSIQFNRNVDDRGLSNRNIAGVAGAQSFNGPGGYLIVSNETDITGQTNMLLSKIDQTGNEMWSCVYGSSKNDLSAAVTELPDSRILILGTIQLDIQLKIALLKVNPRGQFTR